jgi:hypothetical protein
MRSCSHTRQEGAAALWKPEVACLLRHMSVCVGLRDERATWQQQQQDGMESESLGYATTRVRTGSLVRDPLHEGISGLCKLTVLLLAA